MHLSVNIVFATALSIAALAAASGAEANKLKVFYNFAGGSNGADPLVGPIRDDAGNLYGTTVVGGVNCDGNGEGCGTVYKLTPKGKETVLHAFTGGADGANPQAGLVMDASGNLYGTTIQEHGAINGGTVFKISPKGKETVLYAFTDGRAGSLPYSNLILDSAGNLYGTADFGGAYAYYGTVYKLTPEGKETVLYSFAGGSDGGNPIGGLIRDQLGNFYGTTERGGGACDCGTVFKLTPDGKETVLHSFTGGSDGASPYGGLIADAAGNFYGTTEDGGAHGSGVLFKLSSKGKQTLLYSFAGGSDGANPLASPIMDAAGNLYGTTYKGGGACNCGTAFKLTPEGKETVLHAFTGESDGGLPYGGLVIDQAGNFYGAAVYGGAYEEGVVFKIRNR